LLVLQATHSYVNDIRQRIGNSAFTALFEMGASSALAIILDITGSMENEINAVKQEIIEIVTVSAFYIMSKKINSPYLSSGMYLKDECSGHKYLNEGLVFLPAIFLTDELFYPVHFWGGALNCIFDVL
jgi:hypothetical protein